MALTLPGCPDGWLNMIPPAYTMDRNYVQVLDNFYILSYIVHYYTQLEYIYIYNAYISLFTHTYIYINTYNYI